LKHSETDSPPLSPAATVTGAQTLDTANVCIRILGVFLTPRRGAAHVLPHTPPLDPRVLDQPPLQDDEDDEEYLKKYSTRNLFLFIFIITSINIYKNYMIKFIFK
jgi:hypothetical protein